MEDQGLIKHVVISITGKCLGVSDWVWESKKPDTRECRVKELVT